MIQIIPAVLAKTPEDYQKDIAKLKAAASFQEGWVHIDFADNEFVPNQTIGLEVVVQYPINLNKEAHLMVEHPLDWIEKLQKVGFKRVIFHFESKDDLPVVIEAAKKAGMEVGIAINPETPIETLVPYKDKIDQVLVMGIIPGFQGQPFIPATIERIKALKLKDWRIKISIDGAVSDLNARELVEAGVDQLTIGSFLLKGDADASIEKIWEVIQI